MFTDELRSTVWNEIGQADVRAFSPIFNTEQVEAAADRAGLKLVQSPLNLVNLAWLAISCGLHGEENFAGVLTFTLGLLLDAGVGSFPPPQKLPRNRKRHDPRQSDPTHVTEEAFTAARKRVPLAFWMALLAVLGQWFEADHPEMIRWKTFRLVAMDGTELNLPDWKALREYFGATKNKSGKHLPQARMVMMQFPLARLPYRYELVPKKLSEKTVAVGMIKHLQPNDLLLLDRGFWSYEVFSLVLDQNAHFGIRLKKGALLKVVRRLGINDRLVQWNVPRKHKNKGYRPSMLLRKIDYQIPGFRPSSIITSVTDPQQTSREDWVRLATETEPGAERLGLGLYHRRWEIETTFSEMKTYQGLGKKFRGRKPEAIAFEVFGHVLLYHLVRWLMVRAAVAKGLDPLRLSFVNALREVNRMMRVLVVVSPRRATQVLLPQLLDRIARHLVPQRPGRHFPRPNDTKVKNKGNGEYRIPHKLPARKA